MPRATVALDLLGALISCSSATEMLLGLAAGQQLPASAPNKHSSCHKQMKKNLLVGAEQKEGPAWILSGAGWV